MRTLVAATTAILLLVLPAGAEVVPLPVLTVTVYPGDAISGDTLADKPFKVNAAALSAYATRRAQLDGKFAKRTLVAGQPIPLAALKERDVVKQGVAANAVYRAGGLTITTRLIPLRSAVAGEMVEARNPDSGLIVRVVAQADGTLQVGAP